MPPLSSQTTQLPRMSKRSSLLLQPYNVSHSVPRSSLQVERSKTNREDLAIFWSADGLPPLSSQATQLPRMSKRSSLLLQPSDVPFSFTRSFTKVEQASFALPSHAKELPHQPQSGSKLHALQTYQFSFARFFGKKVPFFRITLPSKMTSPPP